MVVFQLTLAGWGELQIDGRPPRPVAPGTGVFAMPSHFRCHLPPDSPGWTFARIGIVHTHLFERIARQVSTAGFLIDVAPDGPLADAALRLVRGAIGKDFADLFEVEWTLIQFVLAYEQAARQGHEGEDKAKGFLNEVRSRILASLPSSLDVSALAAEYGMSRTYFSHYFRRKTGLTPARFATQVRVQEASRMIVETCAPLKRIADVCGFANPNHFSKVFRRFENATPGSRRRGSADAGIRRP